MQVIWNFEPDENVAHIEQHGLTIEDVEFVLENYQAATVSRSSQRPCVFGYTPDGVYVIVVFDRIDDDTIYPITAYEVDEP